MLIPYAMNQNTLKKDLGGVHFDNRLNLMIIGAKAVAKVNNSMWRVIEHTYISNINPLYLTSLNHINLWCF